MSLQKMISLDIVKNIKDFHPSNDLVSVAGAQAL